MGFKVAFKIKRNRVAVSGGILVYETTTAAQRGRSIRPDFLDQDGRVNTEWHSDWANEEIEVYCHTDGINRGKPAYVGRVTLKAGAYYELSTR